MSNIACLSLLVSSALSASLDYKKSDAIVCASFVSGFTVADSFPEHPFWTFSLALYAQPGVADACLKLQDEFGLDVNLVLFCIWCGMDGPGELAAAELSECTIRAGRWQSEVVERIRYIRRTLKQDHLGAPADLVKIFRPKVQALEIEGEHVEQLLLASVVPLSRGATGVAAARQNLSAYLSWAGLSNSAEADALVEAVLLPALQ